VAVAITSFDRGGTERQTAELVTRLDPSLFEVHVICLRREGAWLPRVEARAASVAEFRVRSLRAPSSLGAVRALSKWLRARRIAILHTCDLYANIVGLAAGALSHVPVRIGSRRGIVSPVATRGLLAMQRAAYLAAHRIVANSEAAATRLRHEGIAAASIDVIPNGIDVAAFPLSRRSTQKTITTIANLRIGKAHDVLLEAAALVLKRHPDARFRIVGDGPLGPELDAQARALGISAHVDFLGARDDVPEQLRSSDVFAFPSLMEAFPNGVMEAMAAGLPVVATDVGGIPELVEHDANGLLVPPGDAQALAAGILRFLDDRAHADACGRAARQMMAARYSYERTVEMFESLYIQEWAARNGRVGSALPIRSSMRL
jgi:glycosyltransferase involved in cell wall biosynthesis